MNNTSKSPASKPYVSQYRKTEKPPLPKGRGTTEGGGGIQKRDFSIEKIPQSASQTAPFRQGGL